MFGNRRKSSYSCLNYYFEGISAQTKCWACGITGLNNALFLNHIQGKIYLYRISNEGKLWLHIVSKKWRKIKWTICIFKKYKTFSVLIYSYINTSGNWKNEKLCGNTTPAGRSVFTQFRVFPVFTSVDITVYQYGKNVLYFFYNIAQRTLTEEWREIFRVNIELYQLQRSEFKNAIL